MSEWLDMMDKAINNLDTYKELMQTVDIKVIIAEISQLSKNYPNARYVLGFNQNSEGKLNYKGDIFYHALNNTYPNEFADFISDSQPVVISFLLDILPITCTKGQRWWLNAVWIHQFNGKTWAYGVQDANKHYIQ